MYLYKGYDFDRVRDILAAWRYIPHILARSEEAKQKKDNSWLPDTALVERTHSWLNRIRRLLVRWEKTDRKLFSDVPFRLCLDLFSSSRILHLRKQLFGSIFYRRSMLDVLITQYQHSKGWTLSLQRG